MSEGTPTSLNENQDIGRLIRDLESELDGLATGLGRIRNSLARISVAASALALNAASVSRNDPDVSSEPEWHDSGAAIEPAGVSSEAAPAEGESKPVEPGFAGWGSVADGASWPRLRPTDLQAETEAEPAVQDGSRLFSATPDAVEVETEAAGQDAWTEEAQPDEMPVGDEAIIEPAVSHDSGKDAAWAPVEVNSDEMPVADDAAVEPSEPSESGEETSWMAPVDEVPAPEEAVVEPEVSPSSVSEDVWTSQVADEEHTTPPEAFEEPASTLPPADEEPAGATKAASSGWEWTPAPADSEVSASLTEDNDGPSEVVDFGRFQSEKVAEPGAPRLGDSPRAEEAKPGLSSGWPDESLWAQSFEWPPIKTPSGAGRGSAEPGRNDGPSSMAGPEMGAQETEPTEAQAEINDIVAQFRAELAAGGQPEEAAPVSIDWPAIRAEASLSESQEDPEGGDEESKRDEVSRAVAEIRRQIEAGGLESVMREEGLGFGPISVEGSETAAGVSGYDDEASPDRPAFRLAAPGSLPDWSHSPMEMSGPPVVVMKDASGRVELAGVYETLNAIGCGDGAALLNYTPHSVTVGLPASAEIPSNDRLADAVARVFGRTSRVESDGARITVTIGVESKRGSAA
jgi:hypothetical protein